jgi:hypothetical protein
MSGSEAQATPGAALSSAVKREQTSVLLHLLPHILQTLKREPALGITLGYLLVAMAGIFYNYRFYSKFGIPVLTLSQIGDFLVAGIQQPMALLLVLTTFPLCWIFDFFNARSRARSITARESLRAAPASWWRALRLRFLDWRIEKRWYTQLGYLAVVVGYGWMFVNLYADYRADRVQQGDAVQVTVYLNGDARAFAPTQSTTWTYLGAVANYVFVYDPAAGRSVILPVNNIARIEPFAQATASPAPSIIVAPIP